MTALQIKSVIEGLVGDDLVAGSILGEEICGSYLYFLAAGVAVSL